MSDLLSLLASRNFVIGYIVIGVSCILCLMIYFVEKNTSRRRMRHNTRELNKLVEQVKEEVPVQEEVYYEEPVMEPIVLEEASPLQLDSTIDEKTVEEDIIDENVPVIIDKVEEKEELEYTTIEPDQATAKLELQKIAEELKKESSLEDTQNISLTNYEEQQEENAIISLEELVRKSKKMYESNEITQYADEGNEPISLQELAERVGISTDTSYEEPFIISNVVPEEENTSVDEVEEKVDNKENSNTTVKGFQSSPIISPIYGIEYSADSNDLALENTANYEKLDQEIKRTNEFLMTLKELQNELKR